MHSEMAGTKTTQQLGLEARVVATNNSAESLSARVLVLADRLLGPRPTEAKGSGDQPSPYGIFEQITEHSIMTQRKIDEAHQALDRIEAAL